MLRPGWLDCALLEPSTFSSKTLAINGGSPTGMWNAARPALVALDPTYKGDEKAFCDAYANNKYAPDLQTPWVAPYDAAPPKM